MRRLSAVLALAAAAAACTRVPLEEPADDLAGFRGRLSAAPGVRLSVEGFVADRKAEVWLDVASPLSTVTAGCFANPPSSDGVVRAPSIEGPLRELPVVKLRLARVGSLRLGTRDVGLLREPKCSVALGSDVLLPYAIHVDPARREVALSPSLPRESYTTLIASPKAQRSGDEFHLIELTRDPTGDWPLLAVRLRQGQAQLTGPFVLATREVNTVVLSEALQGAGFRAGLQLSDAQPQPGASLKPTEGAFAAYRLDDLELTPGFGLRKATVWTDGRWRSRGALGLLGANVWGRFHVTVDVQAGVLVLRRPRVLAAGRRQQCVRGDSGQLSEEACFALESAPSDSGFIAVGTVWRDLPEGGRLYLEPVAADGARLAGECRIGLAFGSTDRGASTQHRFPWEGLERNLPGCAATLRQARGARLALFEEGGMAECPGQCAFATSLVTGRTSCECAPHLGGASGDEQKFLELYRELLERNRPPAAPEPEDEDEPE